VLAGSIVRQMGKVRNLLTWNGLHLTHPRACQVPEVQEGEGKQRTRNRGVWDEGYTVIRQASYLGELSTLTLVGQTILEEHRPGGTLVVRMRRQAIEV
jgi:hypothetical protein